MNGSGVLLKTVYYVGAYEKEVIPGSSTKEFHYIYGGDWLAAILKRQNGSDTMYYIHKDHLGSFDKVTNSSGTVIQSTSFDACSVKHGFWEERAKADVELIPPEEWRREGRRRNPSTWTYSSIPATKFSRAYTSHEHLDQFDLINMNGRMYDPLPGRFLSPDPVLADPYFTQD